MSARRGLTIAETLVVAVIIGLMLFTIAGAVPSLLSAPARAQAKADSISPAASGLYLFERDLRESDASGIFACTGWPASCGSGSIGTDDTAIVVATAFDSSDLGSQFQIDIQQPAWQGFIVYWQRAPGDDVYRAFVRPATGSSDLDVSPDTRGELQILAQDAVATAAADTQPQIALRSVAELSAAVDSTDDVTSIHLVTSGKAGYEQNTTTFDDDVLAHN